MSMIDFALVSPGLCEAVQVWVDIAGPWASHYGLFFTVDFTPSRNLVRTFEKANLANGSRRLSLVKVRYKGFPCKERG